jgi:DNA invertase Pin-like site-specific DNA recombinase
MTTIKNVNRTPGRVFSYARWSSDPQSAGDSERRQEQLAINWCKSQGRTLSDQRFTDRGLSGWKGLHRQSGALGALLKIVKAGDIILVEDSDRWSREAPLDSLNALRDVVNRGIEIVFLKTGVRVTSTNFNDPAVLIPNFFASFLANAENEKRAYRIRQAMDARRRQIKAGEAVPGSLPCWLEWDDDTQKVIVIEEKAKNVRRLFEMSLNGLGVQSMINELMTRGVPCPSRGKNSKWNTRLVHRLLTDKGVIGYHVSTGTPNVYPAIISEPDFYASKEKMKARRYFTARIKYVNNNVFTGLCKCSICAGSLIRTVCKHGEKRYVYLCCADGLRGWKKDRCKVRGKTLNYDQFEKSFLSLIFKTDLVHEALSSGNKMTSRLEALKGELHEINEQANKIMGLIMDDPHPPRRLREKLDELETKERILTEQIEVEEAKTRTRTPTDQAYARLTVEFSADLSTENRGKLRTALRSIVNKIVVDLEHGSYAVLLHSARMPIDVLLRSNGWLINPTPREALAPQR